jgi:conjugal transfer pilus assembly protein TraW
MKKIILTISLATVCFAGPKIIEVCNTYGFAEKDMLVELQQRVEEKKPLANKLMREFQKKSKKRVVNWKPEGMLKLTPAKEDKVFYPDLTYILEEDMVDADGRIIYPKGYKYSIGDYMNIPYQIIVFDPTVKAQTEWVKRNGFDKNVASLLLITDGKAIDLMNEFKRPVYFCVRKLQDRFALKHTPSVVVQVGNKLQVTEVNLYKGSK